MRLRLFYVALLMVASMLCFSTMVLCQVNQAQQQLVAATTDASPCGELLQHGIYDHFRSVVSNTTSSQIQTEVCSAYNQLQRDIQSGAGQGQAYYSLFSGSVSYSRDQLLIVGQMMCASSNNQAYSDSQLTTVSDTISDAAMTAYRECIALNSAGLKSSTIFRESDQAQVTLSLHYVPPIGTSAQTKIDRVAISPENSFRCIGTLWDLLGKDNGLGTQEAAISCERAITSSQTPGATLASAATITVMTPVGTVNRNFAPVVAPLLAITPSPTSGPAPILNNGPIFVTPDGKVGIKTPNPLTDFHVKGNAIIGVDTDSNDNGPDWASASLRVSGSNEGILATTLSTGGGNAIWGRATASTGNASGVVGVTSAPGGTGVAGIGIATYGNSIGLSGESRSSQGTAIQLLNAGGGDLIRALGTNNTVVFRVDINGNVYVRGQRVF